MVQGQDENLNIWKILKVGHFGVRNRKNKIPKNGEIPTYARYGKSSSHRKPSFAIGLFFDILENMIFGISRVEVVVLTNTWFVVLVGER